MGSAILGLEEVVQKADELHAITLIYYESFVEGVLFANTSEVYKTLTSTIERMARETCEALENSFKELYALMREGSSTEKQE